jgi:hypothetical protein
MEISDLGPQSVQNYDRIIPEMSGKGRSNVEILIILAKAVKFLISDNPTFLPVILPVPGLRVYEANQDREPAEVLPPLGPRKYWTRRGIAGCMNNY